jgi:di/tripeptidase
MPAKKKVAPKRKPVKRVTAKPRAVKEGIEIDNEEIEVRFNVRENGELLGTIEDQVCNLHRDALICQFEAQEKGKEDYISLYAQRLTKKFGFNVSSSAAYKIAIEVFDLFEDEKKNTGG